MARRASSRQPRAPASGHVATPDKGRKRQTMVTAKATPCGETKTASPGGFGMPKPRGKQGDASKAPKSDDDRLWDPSKGIKMPPKQTQIPTASRPGASTSAESDSQARPEINKRASQRASPTNPTFSEARPGNSKKVEMAYHVADTYDPDSFDRGGIVQVTYEASKSNSTPKTSPNSQERRSRHRNRDRARAKGHWGNPANDLNNPDEFSKMVHQMVRQVPRRSPSAEGCEEPIRPPSNALLEWISSAEDKLLGRFINQPGKASGASSKHENTVSLADLSLGTQATDTTLGNSTANDSELEMLDRMMCRHNTPPAAAHTSLGTRCTESPTTDSIEFTGLGDQFVIDDGCV